MRQAFERVLGESGLQSLNSLWGIADEVSKNRYFTHSYYYYLACLLAFQITGGNPEIEFIVGSSDCGCLIASFERISKRYGGYGIKTLRSPSTIYMPFWDLISIPQPNGPPCRIGFADILTSSSAEPWDIVRLFDVPDDSVIFSQLEQDRRYNFTRWETSPCDYLLCQKIDDFLGGLSKNFRSSLRKDRNKLQQIDNVEFRSHVDSVPVKQALETFLMLESSGWKGVNNSSIVQNHTRRLFYDILFEEYPKGHGAWCEINELWAKGKLLASQLCLGIGSTLFVEKIAYDESYSRVAPGNMLLEWVLTRCGNEGPIRKINLCSDSAWHKDWKPLSTKRWNVEVYNKTVGGLLMRAKRLIQLRL